MSDQDNKSWGINTIMTGICMLCGLSSTILAIFLKLQLENIALNQQVASMTIMTSVSDKYVSKVEILAMTDTLSRLTSMSVENNTAIKLIQNQLSKQQYQRLN
jgi:hypothetical protein